MSDVIKFPQIVMADAMAKYGLTDTGETISKIEMCDLYAPVKKRTAADSQHTKSDTVKAFMQDSNSELVLVDTTGWTNQELADLYRAQRILALTGISINVDHGVTDEGDPWFVFIDSQDEVFAHFSRFDGLYMVSSLVQEKPIKGHSLQDLVSQFSALAKPASSDARVGQNIVSIVGRNSNVVLIHPAAALAALVWSIFLMSDSLVAATSMITEEALENNANTEVSSDFHNFVKDLDIVPEVAQKALNAISETAASKQVIDQHLLRDSAGATVSSGISMKALGIGLSFVALSIGIPIPAGIIDDDESESMSQQLSSENILIKAQEMVALAIAKTDTALHQKTDWFDHINDETSAETEISVAALDIDGNVELSTNIQAVVAPYGDESQAELSLKQAAESRPVLDAEVAVSAKIDEKITEGELFQSPNLVENNAQNTINDASLLNRFDAAFGTFTLTNLHQIDIGEMSDLLIASDTVRTQDVIEQTKEIKTYDAYDQNAQLFLNYLLRTHSDVKIVSLPTEVIFIYANASEAVDDSHELYAKSWSFDDSGIITTIGLKSDMALFDLVA